MGSSKVSGGIWFSLSRNHIVGKTKHEIFTPARWTCQKLNANQVSQMKLSLISITDHVTSSHSSREGQGMAEVGLLEVPTCCFLAGASQLSSMTVLAANPCVAPCAEPALGTAWTMPGTGICPEQSPSTPKIPLFSGAQADAHRHYPLPSLWSWLCAPCTHKLT